MTDLSFVRQHLLGYAADLNEQADDLLDAAEQRGGADRSGTLKKLALARRAQARECRDAARRLERGGSDGR